MLQPRASRLPVVPLFSAPAPSLAASAEVVHAGSAPGLGRRGEMLSFGNQSPASTGICSRRSKCLQLEEGHPGQKGLENILCAPMNFRTCLLRPWPPSCPATAAPPRPRLSGKPCSERMPVWKGRVPTCAVLPEAGGCCAPASSVSECPLLIVRWAAASEYHRRCSGHSTRFPPTGLEAGAPRSRWPQGWFLREPLPGLEMPASCCRLTWWRERGLWSLLLRVLLSSWGSILIAHLNLITSQTPHLQILAHWGLGLGGMHVGVMQTFSL